jgi:hypothetical protein
VVATAVAEVTDCIGCLHAGVEAQPTKSGPVHPHRIFSKEPKADGVRAAAVHPGVIQTELSRHMKPEDLQQMMERMNEASLRSGGPPPAIKPFRKARRPQSGPGRSRLPVRSAVAIASAATWPNLPLDPTYATAYEPMRSIPTAPERSGPKVSRWSASGSEAGPRRLSRFAHAHNGVDFRTARVLISGYLPTSVD